MTIWLRRRSSHGIMLPQAVCAHAMSFTSQNHILERTTVWLRDSNFSRESTDLPGKDILQIRVLQSKTCLVRAVNASHSTFPAVCASASAVAELEQSFAHASDRAVSST